MAVTSTISHHVAADRASVWRLWSEAAGLVHWDADVVEGGLELGEHCVFHWTSLGVSLELDVIERAREERLRLRAYRPDGSAQDLVVEFANAEPGSEVRVRIEGQMSADELEGTLAGWHTQLRVFELAATRYARLERRSSACVGPTIASATQIFAALCKPQSWWSQEDLFFMAEDLPFAFRTHEGLQLTGDILSYVPERELALSVNELGGVVRLRSLPLMGDRARLACAMVSRWGDAPAAEAIEASLRAAIDRLVAQLGGAAFA